MLMMGESAWAGVGSTIASVMFLWMAARQYLPRELELYVHRWASKLTGYVYPYVEISFPEYAGERLKRSEAYTAIEAYLGTTCTERAKRLKAEMGKDSSNLVLSMAEYEEVTDVFHGATFWWTSSSASPRTTPSFSFYPAPEEKRYYRLTFHRRHRKLVAEAYLAYVMEEGKAIGVRKRQRKLYTNNPNLDWYEYRKQMWSHVAFEHPATFDTLAMNPDKKRDIIQDLTTFRESKEYYARIGKPWKRGYLLYGPPGTGKSTMIAAMANFLDYDVYDLELTAVKNNSALRKLLIETTSKSIMVIEDIDCTLDLTGKRKAARGGDGQRSDAKEEEKAKEAVENRDKEDSKVTLSGLLNFIDGLWSACGGERIIVFTTNHVEKLDPALIRRGRMDKHIELSYCNFEAFKLLAGNYLGVDSHPLFLTVHHLMEEAKISPADVAESLIPKTRSGLTADVDACLENLIEALKESKKKQEEEELKKQQEEELKKQQEDEDSKKKQEEESSKKQQEEKAAAAAPSKEDSSSNKDEEPKPQQSQ